jgi:hemerythrin superfamily protein
MANQITRPTATELLRQQHDEVRRMFSQLVPSTGSARAELFDCLRATLAVHETAEEIVVYPEVRALGDEGQRIADARLEEESAAKQMLADLEKIGPEGGAAFDELLEKFRTAVVAHASAEETEVFPLLESTVEGNKLGEMADAILVAEDMAPTHPHPHGPDSALGNLLIGPFVALVDKVRDKLNEHGKDRR